MDFLDHDHVSKSPRLDYALSEYQTKRWLIEAQTEGRFPVCSGERYSRFKDVRERSLLTVASVQECQPSSRWLTPNHASANATSYQDYKRDAAAPGDGEKETCALDLPFHRRKSKGGAGAELDTRASEHPLRGLLTRCSSSSRPRTGRSPSRKSASRSPRGASPSPSSQARIDAEAERRAWRLRLARILAYSD